MYNSLVDIAMLSEGAITYEELKRLPLTELVDVINRVQTNLRTRSEKMKRGR